MSRWPITRLIAAGLAAALTTTACLPGTLNLPLPSIDVDRITNQNGMIAYLGDDGNIYIANPLDTSTDARPIRVTDDAKAPASEGSDPYLMYGLPSWSPDGKYLAFSAVSGSGQTFPTTNQVVLVNRDGQEAHAAYDGEHWPIYYNWSPNSSQLGVLTQSAQGQTFALRRVGIEGDGGEAIDTGVPLFWAWSPDSGTMLVHASNTRLAALQLGSVVQERDLGLQLGAFQAPAISPDGLNALAAVALNATTQQLVRIDLGSGDVNPLIEVGSEVSFNWSPDGNRVALIARSTDNKYNFPAGPLTVLSSGNGAVETTVDEDVIAFFWAPNGKRLAYLALIDPKDGSAFPNITLKLLDVGGWTPREIVAISPTNEFMSQIVPLFDQFSQSTTPWSPDSSSFVLTIQESSSSTGVYQINLDGASGGRRIGSGPVAFWSSK